MKENQNLAMPTKEAKYMLDYLNAWNYEDEQWDCVPCTNRFICADSICTENCRCATVIGIDFITTCQGRHSFELSSIMGIPASAIKKRLTYHFIYDRRRHDGQGY